MWNSDGFTYTSETLLGVFTDPNKLQEEYAKLPPETEGRWFDIDDVEVNQPLEWDV